MGKQNKEIFTQLNSFDLSVVYSETTSTSESNVHHQHAHEECEIYVNISGDVSFAVENSIYPISSGSIVITRPFEYHHCVYHTDKLHKHFWILFSSVGNEWLLDRFFNRKAGEGNLLFLPPERVGEFISLCGEMTTPAKTQVEKYCRFFKLINFLQMAESLEPVRDGYRGVVTAALGFISENLSMPITVGQIAHAVNVSVNTLERHFKRELNATPMEYIKKKRLALAAKLLAEGQTVTEASENSGFGDYSGFIALFKSVYGITPLKYKKGLKGTV